MSRDPSLTRAVPRLVPALAALLMLGIILGCMSLNIGGHVCSELEGEVLEQCGQVNVRPDEEQLVYYPIPYASPPNLTLDDCRADKARIVDQQADHFRIVGKCSPFDRSFEIGWTARGIPAPRVAPPAPAVPVSPPCPPPEPPIVPDPPNP